MPSGVTEGDPSLTGAAFRALKTSSAGIISKASDADICARPFTDTLTSRPKRARGALTFNVDLMNVVLNSISLPSSQIKVRETTSKVISNSGRNQLISRRLAADVRFANILDLVDYMSQPALGTSIRLPYRDTMRARFIEDMAKIFRAGGGNFLAN